MPIEPEYAQTDVFGNPLDADERAWVEDQRNSIRFDKPVTKQNWKTAESRDEWADLLSEAAKAKQFAEWWSVLSDKTDRKAAIIHVNNLNREEWLKRVGEYGLSYRDIRYTEPYNGFSHKHYPTDKRDPNRVTYAVIAENDDVADKMEEAELRDGEAEKHEIVGELLGFPECCRQSFRETFIEQKRIDPMYEVSCQSDCAEAIDGDNQSVYIPEVNPWTNVLYRYFGYSFITHIPCKWDCEKSAEIGEARGEMMAEHGHREAANKLWEWLRLPMTWTNKTGLAHIRNQHFTGSSSSSSYWTQKRVVWGDEHLSGGSIV